MHYCVDCRLPCHAICGITIGDEGCGSGVRSLLCQKSKSQQKNRVLAVKGLEKQADRMLARTNAKFSSLAVGDNVRVAIPDEDRVKMGPRNVLCVVLTAEEEWYTVGNKKGTLNRCFVRADLDAVVTKFLKVEDVPNCPIALRHCGMKSASDLAGIDVAPIPTEALQPAFCKCMKRCASKLCPCKKQGYKCGSQCHNSSFCANKG